MAILYRLAAITLAFLLSACAPEIEAPPGAHQYTAELALYGLFDLGVTDADGDGRLDLYTSNHSARQSVALNLGNRQFTDVFGQWRLDQDRQFPGLYVAPSGPIHEKPGVYVYWDGPRVRVDTSGLRPSEYPIKGHMDLLSQVRIERDGEAEVTVTEGLMPRNVIHTSLNFTLTAPGDAVAMVPLMHALPIEVDLGFDPARIYVGMERVSPRASKFHIFMRDRHGMAWNDIGGDGRPDVYITRGALHNALSRYPLRFWDELFLMGPEGTREVGAQVGLEKHGCPGRQAAWVDYDGDGRSDIYVVCGRRIRAHNPNQLFHQLPDGTFEERAVAEGLAFTTAGRFVWVDLWGTPLPELLWADGDGLRVCTRGVERFRCTLYEDWRDSVPTALRITDVDQDGDLDAFVVSDKRNRVFLQQDGKRRFVSVDPQTLGLPARSLDAVWVDLDNDGRDELHTMPGGIFARSEGENLYRPVQRIGLGNGTLSPWQLADARVTWADMNGDGARDAVLALNVVPKPHWWADWLAKRSGYRGGKSGALRGEWRLSVLEMPVNENHWLELDLVGSPKNRAAVGTRVRVVAGGRPQVRFVGHAEGARFSSGHHRVYFGLGQAGQVDELNVSWSDAPPCMLRALPADRLYQVERAQDGSGCIAKPANPGSTPASGSADSAGLQAAG